MITTEIAQARLQEMGAEVHSLKVTGDKKVLVFHATYPEHLGQIKSLPVLFVTMCVGGGGPMQQNTSLQFFESNIGPGDIGVVPPNAKGTGEWPEISVISIGIAVEAVAESFGDNWPTKLKKETFSKVFRDPLVESTLMNVGYSSASDMSDATIIHAAHMVTHQLLDQPFDEVAKPTDVAALNTAGLSRVKTFLSENLDRHVTVEEMASVTGISRHHFSRRFKAATGQSPHQFSIQQKLNHAADLLAEEESASVISIAQMIGYSNPAQFSKLFRRQFGLTPRTWRSQKPRH
ncbi:MAG: AraC family transcriptional regulator [Pseudomonadota bacterium]